MSVETKERSALQVLESIEKGVGSIAVNQAPHRKKESDDLKELYKALHSAQLKFKSIVKTGSAPAFNSGQKHRIYAKMDDIVEATRLALHANNLVCSTFNYVYPNMVTSLVTRLYHFTSGQFIESELPLLNSAEEQKRGSSITYAWRYTYAPLMGLVDSSYDDDGEATTNNYKK